MSRIEPYRHWLALKRIPGVGNVVYKRLLEVFQSPEAVFDVGEEALLKVEGITTTVAAAISNFDAFNAVDLELEKIEKGKVSLISLKDPNYPPLLSAIYDPPPLLYTKGSGADQDFYPVAVVGARRATHYGKSAAERLSRDLARWGITVVSGFARGIDAIAHRAALEEGGRTYAVLGSGIDVIYPGEHKALFDKIAEQGIIFSEFPMGAPPDPHHFPQRNRIISGLSLGCVVIEAGVESGSLITARLALEQGRDVFAVPGLIHSETSAGPHRLIQSGAKLVHDVGDILEEIRPHLKTATNSTRSASERDLPLLEEKEEMLYRILSLEPKHIDQVIHETSWRASDVSGLLLSLELKGAARQLAGKFYVRI